MRRALGRVGSTLSLAALVVLLLAPAAQGKGDTLVTVVGPGLEGPLTITQGAGSGLLMKPSGFWDQACSSHGCRAEGRFLDRRPVGDLGPRYTLTWTLEFVTRSHEVKRFPVLQYVFPFAQPQPVTYMPPGQLYLPAYRTGGGWFVARSELLPAWSDLGLPATMVDAMPTPPIFPSTTRGGWSLGPWVIAAAFALLAVGLVLLLGQRHRYVRLSAH
jgi:hypothetical protein